MLSYGEQLCATLLIPELKHSRAYSVYFQLRLETASSFHSLRTCNSLLKTDSVWSIVLRWMLRK